MLSCEQIRAALSARLDGEAPGIADDVIDAHLAGCSDCTAFYERAVALNEQLATGLAPVPAAMQPPDLADAILAEVEPQWRRSAANRAAFLAIARVVLALIAMIYVVWAVMILADSTVVQPIVAEGQPLPERADPALANLLVEAASVRLALALGLATVAWRPRLAAGLVPVVAALWTFGLGFAVRGIFLGALSTPQLAHLGLLALSALCLGMAWYFGPSGRTWQESWRTLGSRPY